MESDAITTSVPPPRWMMRAMHALSAVLGTMATGLITLGTHYQETYTNAPNLTGTVRAPAATIGWGILMTTTAPALQLVARHQTKKNVARATAVLGVITAGMMLTTLGMITAAGSTELTIEANMARHMSTYGNNENIDTEIDEIQESYHCCGATDLMIYQEADNYLHGAVPASCCRNKITDCGTPPVGTNAYTEGCSTKVGVATKNAMITMAMALATAGGTLAVITIGLATNWLCAS